MSAYRLRIMTLYSIRANSVLNNGFGQYNIDSDITEELGNREEIFY